MAELHDLFETFLSNIEPSCEAVRYAQDAHKPVRECLAQDEQFAEHVESTFLYGSYRRHTAVCDIKDVDIVVLTNFDLSDEINTPRRVLRKLKDALARCYDDPKNADYQRRSIRINDPLPDNPDVEMTLDIIPAVAIDGADEPFQVPDRDLNRWIWSHPKGHLVHATALNAQDYSAGKFVPLVKMMKWWWRYQCELRQPEVERPHPKGFWVECLTGENFDPEQQGWADHFIATLQNVAAEYAEAAEVPALKDPGMDGETIKTSMTLGEFTFFMTVVNDSLAVAEAARAEPDKLRSSELWRDLFGDLFPLYDAEESEKSRRQSSVQILGSTRHVEPLHWPEINEHGYKVRIDAHVYYGDRRLSGLNSNGRVIASGLNLRYMASTNVPHPYEVYWQVVNTGRHAEREQGLRGSFFQAKLGSGTPSDDPRVNWEHTLYSGKHWIECFIVKNGRCVARSGRFYVSVRNPAFP